MCIYEMFVLHWNCSYLVRFWGPGTALLENEAVPSPVCSEVSFSLLLINKGSHKPSVSTHVSEKGKPMKVIKATVNFQDKEKLFRGKSMGT